MSRDNARGTEPSLFWGQAAVQIVPTSAFAIRERIGARLEIVRASRLRERLWLPQFLPSPLPPHSRLRDHEPRSVRAAANQAAISGRRSLNRSRRPLLIPIRRSAASPARSGPGPQRLAGRRRRAGAAGPRICRLARACSPTREWPERRRSVRPGSSARSFRRKPRTAALCRAWTGLRAPISSS